MATNIKEKRERLQRLNAKLHGMRLEELEKLEEAFQNRERMLKASREIDPAQARVNRIVEALERVRKKIELHPAHPSIEGLKRREAELEESLLNFDRYKQEAPPTGAKAGVLLNVPLGRVGLGSRGASVKTK